MSFKYRYQMASFIQLIRNCQSAWATADNRYLFTGSDLWWVRCCISFFICIFNDGIFIFLGCYRISVKSARTCIFAKCRADAGGKFREVICLFQSVICLLPVSGVYQIVPFRNKVMQRASACHTAQIHACLTERYTAFHTSCTLQLLFFFRKVRMEFIKMFDSLFRFLGY